MEGDGAIVGGGGGDDACRHVRGMGDGGVSDDDAGEFRIAPRSFEFIADAPL